MKTTDYHTTSPLINTVPSLAGGTVAEVRRIEGDNLVKTGFFSNSITVPGNITPFFTDEKGVTHEVPNTFSFSGFECYRAKEGHFSLLLVTKNTFTLEFDVNFNYGYDTRIARNNAACAKIAVTMYVNDKDTFFKAFPISMGTRITTTDIHHAVSDGISSVLRAVLRSCRSQSDFIYKSKEMYSIFNNIGLYCTWIDCLDFESAFEKYHKERTERIKAEKEKKKEYHRKLIEDNAAQAATTIAKGLETRQPASVLDTALNKVNQVYENAKKEVNALYEEEKREYIRETRRIPLANNTPALLVDPDSNDGNYHGNPYRNNRKPALTSGGSSKQHKNGYRSKNANGNACNNHKPSNGGYSKSGHGDYYFVKPKHENTKYNKKVNTRSFADSYERSTFYGDKGYDE